MNIIQMGFRLMVDQALYPTGSGPDMLFISPFVGNCQAAVCCQGRKCYGRLFGSGEQKHQPIK